MSDRSGRGIRAWYKRAWRWCLGPVSDPHTHLGSSARIAGHISLATLCRYVLTVPAANPFIVGSLVTLIVACFGLRAKSTQASMLTPPAPRYPADEMRAPMSAPIPRYHEAPTVAPAPEMP